MLTLLSVPVRKSKTALNWGLDPMPRISRREFEGLPLRVHQFLHGVPLHDVWAVELPAMRSGITLDEFRQAADGRLFRLSPVVRALLTIRFFVGRILRWDREPDATVTQTFASRLTAADRSESLALAGTHEGLFRIVYRFKNEQLLEVINSISVFTYRASAA